MKIHYRIKISFISLFLIVVFLRNNKLFSQNIIPSTLYAFDKYMINSAYAGLNERRVLSMSVREQWLGLSGSPKRYMVSYTSPVYRLHGSVGAKIKTSKSGIQSSFGIDLSYNYVYQTTYGLFSFGLGTGINSLRINNNIIVTPSGFYSKVEQNHNDPYINSDLLFNRYFSKFSIFGMYFYNNLEFGIIFDKELNVSDKLEYGLRDKVLFNWQYLFVLNNEVSLKVFGLIYTDFVLMQNDIGIVGLYKNNYLSGFNLRGYSNRTLDSVSFLLGGNVNYKLRLIYAYDFSMSGLRKVEDGTHEIKIIYDFGKKSINRTLPPMINNPRL